MILVFIGMSGVGKTLWSTRLTRRGFTHVDCDALIAARLRAQYAIQVVTMRSMGAWLGLPDTPTFVEREALFLRVEAEILQDVLHRLRATGPEADIVVDPGGSAIYAGPALWTPLREIATIVYLAVTEADHARMLATYLAHPRPVVWNGLFQPHPDEDRAATFARCYTQLICTREALYETWCDLKLLPGDYRRTGLTSATFLRMLQERVSRITDSGYNQG